MQDAIGVVDPLEIVIHLGAERAAGERMRRVAVQLLGGTVVHFYYPTARVRTVVPACAANDLDRTSRAHRTMVPSNLRRLYQTLELRPPIGAVLSRPCRPRDGREDLARTESRAGSED